MRITGYYKSGFFLLLAGGLSVLVRLGRSVAFSWLVPREVYGQFGFVVSWLGILTVFSLPGMGEAIVQAFGKKKEGVYRPAVREKIRFSLLGILAIVLLAVFSFLRSRPGLGSAFVIAAVFFIPYTCFSVYEFYYQGKKKFKQLAYYLALVDVIVAVLTVAALFVFRSFLPIVIAYLFSVAVVNFFLFRKTLREAGEGASDPEAISFGKHLSLMRAVSLAAEHLDKILLGFFLGLTPGGFSVLAVYWLAYLVYRQVKAVLAVGTINRLILPKFSSVSEEDARRLIREKMVYLWGGLAAAGMVIVLLLRPLMTLVYKNVYIESIGYAQALVAGGVIIEIPAMIFIAFLTSQRKKGELYLVNVISPAVTIILTVVLVYFSGITGAVIARIAGWGVSLILAWKLAMRKRERKE